MACGVYCWVLSKKISSLIKRLSGENERERRAFEEPEKIKVEKESYLSKGIEKLIHEFAEGNNYLYSYYKYLDRFHTEPLDWVSLFEFTEYEITEAKIKNLVQNTGE